MQATRRRFLAGVTALAGVGGLADPGKGARAGERKEADMYADDPDHPIPYLGQLDVAAVAKAGGGDLSIIIASPLQADRRSLERLMRKLENYLGFIAGPDYAADFGGPPTPETTRIVVVIDPASSPEAFELLERCKPWVLENHATLVVVTKPADAFPGQ